jgi:hypothetical protein
MKRLIRRFFLTRELRRLTGELDYVFQVRRETVRRESQLRRRAEAVSLELTRMELRRHA